MRFSLLCISLIIFLFSCKNQSNKIQTLANAEKVIKNEPNNAIKILNEIGNPEDLSNNEMADYWRIKALAHSLSNEAMTEDSLILSSLEYYKGHKNINKLLETYELAALYYIWKKDYLSSINLLKEGIEVAQRQKDNSKVALFYKDIASIYMNNKQYLLCLSNMKRSALYQTNDEPDFYYSTGICYANLGRLDSTQFYIMKSIKLALSKKDTYSAFHFLRNYADILYSNNEYQKTLICIKQALLLPQAMSSPNLFSTASMCYLSLNNIDSAKYYLNQAKYIIRKDGVANNTNLFVTSKNIILTLEALIKYHQKSKVDLFTLSRFNDSIMLDNYNKQLIIKEKANIKQQLQQQNSELKISRQKTQLILMNIFLALMLCIGLIYIYFRNKRAKLIEAEEKIETIQLLLNEAMKAKVDNQINGCFFKNVMLQQLGFIRMVATAPTIQNQEMLKQMARIVDKEIPVSSLLVWEDLYLLIDSIYDNFYSKLSNKYKPLFLEKEIQLCCLLCAEFSTKEISVLTQQSLRTIYQRKTTIRKKLNMDEKEDIVCFIKESCKF